MANEGVTSEDQRGAENSYRMFLSVEPDGDVIAAAIGQFGAWLRSKKSWDAALDGNRRQQDSDRDLVTLHHHSSDGRNFRARLTESTPDGIWRTQLTVQEPKSGLPWIALQVTNSGGWWTAVPWVATFLLDSLNTKDGSTVLSSDARVVGIDKVEDFLTEICDVERQGLIFAAGTGDRVIDFSKFAQQVGRWTLQARGLAQAVVLTPEATGEVWSALGPDHGIQPWTLRTFYPDVDPAIRADGLRHKFVTTERLANEDTRSIQRLLGRVARRHAARRPLTTDYMKADRALRRLEDQVLVESISLLLPEQRDDELIQDTIGAPIVVPPETAEELVGEKVETAEALYVAAGQAVAESGMAGQVDESGASSGLLVMVKDTLGIPEITLDAITRVARRLREAERASAAVGQIRTQLMEIQKELKERQDLLDEAQTRASLYSELYDDAQLDERIATEDAEKLADENRWLKSQLVKAGHYDSAYGDVPDEAYTAYPTDFNGLADRLPELIDRGVIFTGDKKDLLALDEYDTLQKLVRAAWDAFLVLSDYVRARGDGACQGGVSQYLANTPQGYRSISQKRFAGKETAVTMQAWGDLRDFPVPVEIDPSGRKTMEAHFKLGRLGMVSPRMYYLDCWNVDQKVYVGYVGTHLRNTQTN